MRRPIVFSFDKKVKALDMIAKVGFSETTKTFSDILGYQAVPVRFALEELNKTHVLLEEGILEKQNNMITFTYKRFSKQPFIVNSRYLQTLSSSMVTKINEAMQKLKKN